MKKVTAIVLAAGQGKRMNSAVAKQFLILCDKPVIYYSLKAFEESMVNEIILVTGEGQVDYCRKEIVESYHITKVSKIIEGGKERYDSVYAALKNTDQADYVLIHDGARPFISADQINRMIDSVREYSACILGMPVKETIKVVDAEGDITATPDRNTLWAAQTPQGFEFGSIRKAYEMFYRRKDEVSITITDDAMIYEMFLQKPVKMLRGDYNNIKITTPEDLFLAEEIIRRK
ncbi:MAG: ispD [Firmicutes bacterium]|nr:ispD [Bacillota bacterium]